MIDLWLWSLNPAAHEIARFSEHLDAGERERAARFRFEPHATRFVAARGRMREILGSYLQAPSASLAFAYGPQGKPHIVTENRKPLYFNLAHSDDLAALVVTDAAEIGVDIERMRAQSGDEAARLFSVHEQAEWHALPQPQKALGFLQGWTRKEAVIKALGGGLSIPLDSFSVRLSPGEPAKLLTLPPPGVAKNWSLLHFVPATGYVGAIAIAAREQALRVHSQLLP